MAEAVVNRGFGFPLKIYSRGGITAASGVEAIRLAVLTILGTHPGERLMRPDFGCPLRNLVFAPNNAATASLARFYVESALTRWEPRIVLDKVSVVNHNALDSVAGTADDPSLLIEVRYRIPAVGQPGTVTFQLPLA